MKRSHPSRRLVHSEAACALPVPQAVLDANVHAVEENNHENQGRLLSKRTCGGMTDKGSEKGVGEVQGLAKPLGPASTSS